MAQFKVGYTYANRDFMKYAPKRKLETNNRQFAGYTEIDWRCTSVTRVFAVFVDNQNIVQRRKIYKDDLGHFVFPFGRFPQAPVLRAEYSYTNGTLSPDDDGNDGDAI